MKSRELKLQDRPFAMLRIDLSYNPLPVAMQANFLLGQEAENANTEAKYGCFPLTKLSRKFAARVPEWGFRIGLIITVMQISNKNAYMKYVAVCEVP